MDEISVDLSKAPLLYVLYYKRNENRCQALFLKKFRKNF